MLHLKVFCNKILLKYIIIIFLLFVSLIFFTSISDILKKSYNSMKESIENRTIIVEINDEKIIEKIDDSREHKIIENYSFDGATNQYEIVFTKTKYVSSFVNENIENFKNIIRNDFDESGNYELLKNVFLIMGIISTVLIVLLVFIVSNNIIYNLRKDIALYKLIGYKTSRIIYIFSMFIYMLYFVTYILSIISSYLIILFLKYLNVLKTLQSNYIYLLNNYIYIWILISVLIFASFIQTTIKMIKMSPITYMKE